MTGGAEREITAPSRQRLVALGEDLGLPPAWLELAARATAVLERRFLLAQLARRLLVATPHGRARLRAWLDQQRAAPTTPPPAWLLPRWIGERVLVYGDHSMVEAVVTALVLVPAPVRAHALAEVAFEGVGADSRGWYGSSTLVDRDGYVRPGSVRLSGADRHMPDLVRTVVHEVAHAWLLPPPIACVTVQGEVGLAVVARADGWWATGEAHVARHERLAEACALVWGAR